MGFHDRRLKIRLDGVDGSSVEWRAVVRDVGELQSVRHKLAESLRQAGGADADVSDAELVLTELVSNSLRHSKLDVEVSLHRSGGIPVILVVDDGPPFTPPGTEPELAQDCGRGLFIVNAIASDFTVSREKGRNAARAVLGGRAGPAI